MNSLSKLKQVTLLVGDIIVLYASLIVTLWLRYNNLFYSQFFNRHLEPFTIIFIIWLVVFYISGLYDLKSLKNDLGFWRFFWSTLIFNIAIAALFFYLIPYFAITPKTNLLVFLIVFGILGSAWRWLYNILIISAAAPNKILLVGSSKTAEELVDYIWKNPQLGYEISYWMKEGLGDKEFEHLAQIILANKINTVVIPAHLKKDARSARIIYKTLSLGMEVLELSALYELIFKKVPLAELEEVWFLEKLAKNHKIYEFVAAPVEIAFALALAIILSPLAVLIAVLIKATSPGSAFFSQKRIGKNNIEFVIWKFRTMAMDAEKNGPQWANYHKDSRATWIGKILRRSHLDELPQLWNILRGELSFVGPRPERPEFVEKLMQELPYYDLRHLIKPGITGWAQINYRYGASAEDAYQKLQYDIYYLKNKSLILDVLIILRTLKFLITNHS